MDKKKGRLKKAFYCSATSAIYQITSIICGFITSRLIVQYYGSSWNGVLSAITKFLSLFVIVEMGINGSTRVALYDSIARNDNKKTSGIVRANDLFYRKVAMFLLVYIAALAVILPRIVQSDKTSLQIILMIVIIGISNFAENCWGINSKILLTASQNSYIVNVAKTVAAILNATLLAIVITMGGTIFAAKATSSTIFACVPVVLFIISRRMFSIDKSVEPDDSAIKGRWDVIANSVANVVHENVDVFFLTIACDAKEISVYSVYFLIAGGLSQVFKVLTNGLEAGFGNMWARGEIENLKKNVCNLEYLLYTVAILMFGCMIALIVPFMGLYMNNITDVNYQRFSLGLVMGVAELFRSIRTPYVLLVQAAGHYKQVKTGAYIEAIMNIVLTALLVFKFGIMGAILGTIAANVFRTIQYGWYISKHMIDRSFSLIVYRMIWTAVTLTISVVISLLVQNFLPQTSWVGWIATALITGVIHIVVIAISSLLFYKDDMKSCIRLIKRIV